VVVHSGRIAHDGGVPVPVGHHAEPGHDHVHPHAVEEKPGICDWAPADRMAAG
jgi:zinc transport system ATP-binding protein